MSTQIKFCSLASGSSGNCYYVGNEKHGILIDAGIG
ncbi:MAG TPA: MBL fold metallo-hydrolase, partial [Paludibacteraceae bacterium]|nr:MBL fold metallo-hydrolase [Paludibacteraceae bacterium]